MSLSPGFGESEGKDIEQAVTFGIRSDLSKLQIQQI